MSAAVRTYQLEVPGLAEVIAAARPDAKHAALLAALRRHSTDALDLHAAKITAVRGDSWLHRRKVLNAAGELVHDDHEAWLKAECALDGGNVATTWRRLLKQDYRLTECGLTTLYVVADRGGREDNFVQLKIWLEDEWVDRRMFYGERSWAPKDLEELTRLAEDGPRLEGDDRRRYRPLSYQLRAVVDVAQFVSEAQALYTTKNAQAGARHYTFTNETTGRVRSGTLAELFPEAVPHPTWKGRRIFEDWSMSSAGRSGERFCDHWALDLNDWTDRRTQERDMNLIPLWGFTGNLAKVDRPRLSDYALYAKLETLDRRVKVPMGWYFYMLHGNRVDGWVGERVIKAAEAGTIVLPEHDYRVLKAWEADRYGF